MRFLSNNTLAVGLCAAAAFVLVAAGAAESRVLGLGVLALVMAAAVFGVRARLGRHPTSADTERFLVGQLVERGYGGAITLTSVKSRAQRLFGRLQFMVRFSAQVTVNEPLYQSVPLTTEMTGRFTARRVSTLCAIARKISDELGPRADGIGGRVPPDPYERRYVVAASEQGLAFHLQGGARVAWVRNGWRYTLKEMSAEFGKLLETGLPRAKHGQAVVLDSTDGKVWFRDTMRAWSEFEEEIAALQRIAEEARTERARAAAARFFEFIKPGAIFHGIGGTLTGQVPPTPFFLEFTVVDEAAASASFTLRNDSGWQKARAFTGVVSGDDSGEAAIVSGHTRAVDSIEEGGPILDAGTDFEMEVRWIVEPGNQVACSSGDFLLKLSLVPPEEIAMRHAEVLPREALVRAAVADGAAYAGTIRGGAGAEAVSLVFNYKPREDRTIAAIEGGNGLVACSVEIAITRYASEPCDVLLVRLSVATPVAGENETPAPVEPWTWSRMQLSLQGDSLEGWAGTGGDGDRSSVTLRRVLTG
ncbi:MAG: hypothetical protein ACREIA_14460 [Opitutaceae bacterium]